MNVEERIRFLMRIARRVEGEGNERAAQLFRRMADDARPLERETLAPTLGPGLGFCPE